MRAHRHKSGRLMRHHVLLELGQKLFGFGQCKSQLLNPLAVFLQDCHFIDGIRSFTVRTNDQLHLYPHVAPFPAGFSNHRAYSTQRERLSPGF
jgi:hypothetical protein